MDQFVTLFLNGRAFFKSTIWIESNDVSQNYHLSQSDSAIQNVYKSTQQNLTIGNK